MSTSLFFFYRCGLQPPVGILIDNVELDKSKLLQGAGLDDSEPVGMLHPHKPRLRALPHLFVCPDESQGVLLAAEGDLEDGRELANFPVSILDGIVDGRSVVGT